MFVNLYHGLATLSHLGLSTRHRAVKIELPKIFYRQEVIMEWKDYS